MSFQSYEHANLNALREQILANARIAILLNNHEVSPPNYFGTLIEVVTTFEHGKYGAAVVGSSGRPILCSATGCGSPVEALEKLWYCTSLKLGELVRLDFSKISAGVIDLSGSGERDDGPASGYA